MSTIATRDFTNIAKLQIRKYGNSRIDHIVVCRKPLQKGLDMALNFLSQGSWEDLKKEYGYEQFFHLSLLIFLTEGYSIVLEKNSVITISRNEGRENEEGIELMNVEKSYNKNTTFAVFLKNARTYMGDKFFYYEALPSDGRKEANNCQNFVKSCLYANQMMSESLRNFIYQPIEELASKLPWFVNKLVKLITDLGGLMDDAMSNLRSPFHYKKGGIISTQRRNRIHRSLVNYQKIKR